MRANGIGGANTKTGLVFEGKTDLQTFLCKQKGYSCKEDKQGLLEIFFNGQPVGYILKKGKLYKFLESRGVKWNEIISKRLMPDDSIYVKASNTLFIVECKYQQVAGSVDEKLQTCDFKKKQYKKLMSPLKINAQYLYLLCDWFKDPKYRDVLEYIQSVGCSYHFEFIPLTTFGLPAEK